MYLVSYKKVYNNDIFNGEYILNIQNKTIYLKRKISKIKKIIKKGFNIPYQKNIFIINMYHYRQLLEEVVGLYCDNFVVDDNKRIELLYSKYKFSLLYDNEMERFIIDDKYFISDENVYFQTNDNHNIYHIYNSEYRELIHNLIADCIEMVDNNKYHIDNITMMGIGGNNNLLLLFEPSDLTNKFIEMINKFKTKLIFK